MPLPSDGRLGLTDFWSAYMDDYDEVHGGNFEQLKAREGEVTKWQAALRAAYSHCGIPRGEAKAVCGSMRAERLGAELDGAASRAQGTPRKLLEIVSLALFVLKSESVPKKLIEMFVGRLVHRMQFRRGTMGCLEAPQALAHYQGAAGRS